MSLENETNYLNPETDPIKKAILAEIDIFEQNANKLPRVEDIKILKEIQVVWVLSGSGSYLKPLIDTASDQANLNNSWYYSTDKYRLDYAERWLSAYSIILPNEQQPILIYNGVNRQVEDLFKAIEEKKYKISRNQIYIAPGDNIRTMDQVKNFSFPPGLDLEEGYLGVLSHAPHLARILRFMSKRYNIFQDVKVIALPLKAEKLQDQLNMSEPEVKGILDYIKKGEASIDPYPYKLIGE